MALAGEQCPLRSTRPNLGCSGAMALRWAALSARLHGCF